MPLVPALLLLAAAPQWSDDPFVNQAVAGGPGEQVLAKAAAAPDGGSWVAWFDSRSGSYAVRIQRYDSQGAPLLAAGGLLVSDHPQSSSLVNWELIAAADGDAVLAFTDVRKGGDLDVYAYKIGADGVFRWGPDGVAVSDNTAYEADPQLAQTANGDFVVVWNYLPSGDGAIRMQRLNAAGAPLLPPGGINAVTETGRTPCFADVAPAGGDDVIVSWVRDLSIFSSVKHLRAQRFGPAGPVWPAPVAVFDAYNLPIAYAPQLLPDGAGGAVLCWHASDPGAAFLYQAFVQRLDAAGAEVFPHNGALVSAVAGMNHLNPRAAFVPASGAIIVFWTEENSGQSLWGLSAQKLDAAGARAWGAGGVTVQPVNFSQKYPPVVVPFDDGAIAFATWTPSGNYGMDQVLAARVDGAGNLVWGGTRDLCALPSIKSVRLALVPGADGETAVFWEDARNGNPDLYGQNVHADGGLGARYLALDVAAVSLAAGGAATLELDAGATHAGRACRMLGSDTGTSPGQTRNGVTVPLNDGAWFRLTLRNPGFAWLSGFSGALDASGRATASVTVPAGAPPAWCWTRSARWRWSGKRAASRCCREAAPSLPAVESLA